MAPNVNHNNTNNNSNHNKTEGVKEKKKRDTQRILEIEWQQGRSKPQIEIGIACPKYTQLHLPYMQLYKHIYTYICVCI